MSVYCSKASVQNLWFRTSNRWIDHNRCGIEHGACWEDIFGINTLPAISMLSILHVSRESFGRFQRWMCMDLCSMFSFTLNPLNQLRMSVAWEGLWLVTALVDFPILDARAGREPLCRLPVDFACGGTVGTLCNGVTMCNLLNTFRFRYSEIECNGCLSCPEKFGLHVCWY